MIAHRPLRASAGVPGTAARSRACAWRTRAGREGVASCDVWRAGGGRIKGPTSQQPRVIAGGDDRRMKLHGCFPEIGWRRHGLNPEMPKAWTE